MTAPRGTCSGTVNRMHMRVRGASADHEASRDGCLGQWLVRAMHDRPDDPAVGTFVEPAIVPLVTPRGGQRQARRRRTGDEDEVVPADQVKLVRDGSRHSGFLAGTV